MREHHGLEGYDNSIGNCDWSYAANIAFEKKAKILFVWVDFLQNSECSDVIDNFISLLVFFEKCIFHPIMKYNKKTAKWSN